MPEWIEGVKCINSLGCGLMLSILLSLAIQANIAFSSKACNEKGDELDGTSQCEMTPNRIWNLSLFYVGAIIFLIGSLGTCLNNGYVFCVHFLALIGWIGAIIGLSFQRMSSSNTTYLGGFETIIHEFIRQNWGIWQTVLFYVLGISFSTTLVTGIVIVVYFIRYSSL